MDIFKTRLTCRACDGSSLRPVLSLGNQYLPRFVKEPDETLPRAPLDLIRCDTCGLLQLQHTVNPDLLFREFWYRSSINQSMRNSLDEVVAEGMSHSIRRDGIWLDIGANDGYLISQIPAQGPHAARGYIRIACEPALNFEAELNDVADVVIPDYFTAGSPVLEGGCDVITSIAMFYDLDDPNRFVADIAKSLKPDGVWINQLNDAPTMISRLAIDGVCHEHLCYYDVPTLERLYRKHGLQIIRVTHNEVNGGSVRVVAKRVRYERASTDLLGIKTVTWNDCSEFAARARRWQDAMSALLHEKSARAAVWAYGASTKGSTILQYLGEPAACIQAVADRNPLKHGLRMPGTWLRIADENEFRAARPGHALVLPYSFRAEFHEREKDVRAAGTTFIYPLPDISLVV